MANWALILQVITNFLMFLSLSVLCYQIYSTHKWQKHKAAQDLIQDIRTGVYYDNVKKLGKIKGADGQSIDIDRKDQTYSDIVNEDNKECIKECVWPIVTLCEDIALGIKHKIYDEGMISDYCRSFMLDHYRWLKPYINEARKSFSDAYIEFESMCEKWNKKAE